jgi:hypothetical protein
LRAQILTAAFPDGPFVETTADGVPEDGSGSQAHPTIREASTERRIL